MSYAPSKTLCWRCANAVPNRAGTRGCSWSRKFIPVEGWEAKEISVNTHIRVNGSNNTQSFIVRSCPEFVSDGREDEE